MLWKNSFYIDIYEMARGGLTDIFIANKMGVKITEFRKWKKEKPLLEYAINRARKGERSSISNFKNYIYDQMSTETKEIWDRINRYEKVRNGVQKIEAILATNGVEMRQHLFMHALITCDFNPSRACKKVNVSFKTVKNWIENDPEFAEMMEEINFHKGNFFESSLIALVAKGDSNATLFANKTFNKKRGYGEKVEVSHTGDIEYRHTHEFNIESLDLPLEVKRQILEAIRKQQEGQEGQKLLDMRQEGQERQEG